jgi:hypothetical protein
MRRFGRRRRGWEDNIKVKFRQIGARGFRPDLSGSGYGPRTGCYEHGDEVYGLHKRRNIS